MVDANTIYKKLIGLLDSNQVDYKLFTHREALTYETLAEVQKEAGFFGTEMKCMVLKVGDKFIVYVTLQGNQVNFDRIKKRIEVKDIRLSNPKELSNFFGAQPGCAYPFAFDKKYDIYVDPEIYVQAWLLFSPVFPTKTIQAKGADLKRVFDRLENDVYEIANFNQ